MAKSELFSVMLVDDEPIFLESAEKVISNFIDAELVPVQNAEEAEKILETWQPNVLITDTNMPGKNGIELIKHVRAKFPDVVIISLFSGLIDSEITADDVLALGASMVVQKKDFLKQILPALKKLANR